MKIKYLGCSCFSILGKTNPLTEVSLLIDPYSSDYCKYKLSSIKADIVTISHEHSDHNNVNVAEGTIGKDFILINTPGEYEVKGLRIFGFKTYHDEHQGKERGKNTIYVYDFMNARIAHLGDLGHDLSKEVQNELSDIDILMIPVGGHYTIDAKKAINVIEKIEPKIAIPMHYKNKSQYYDTEVKPLENFLSEAGVEKSVKKDITIKSKSDLPHTLDVIPLEVSKY